MDVLRTTRPKSFLRASTAILAPQRGTTGETSVGSGCHKCLALPAVTCAQARVDQISVTLEQSRTTAMMGLPPALRFCLRRSAKKSTPLPALPSAVHRVAPPPSSRSLHRTGASPGIAVLVEFCWGCTAHTPPTARPASLGAGTTYTSRG